MAFTKLYLTNQTPLYIPATIRGAWDLTASAVTKLLDTGKTDQLNIAASVAVGETNASTTYDVLLYRGISGPLDAQTISGTINVVIGVLESNSLADFYWHIHAYVTQGDTDTPRGTLLSDYVENTTNEWSAAAAGIALSSAQSLSSLAITAGDRLVIELGYIARNSVTTNRVGTIYYGADPNFTDLAATESPLYKAGSITFSSSITDLAVTARTSGYNVETLSLPSAPAIVSGYNVETLSLPSAPARVSGYNVETLSLPVAPVRMSQYVIEVLSENLPVTAVETSRFNFTMI